MMMQRKKKQDPGWKMSTEMRRRKEKGIEITSSAQNPQECTPSAILLQQKIVLYVIRTTNHQKKQHSTETKYSAQCAPSLIPLL